MKSVFLKNFTTTALMVFISFLVIVMAFVGIGKTYLLAEYRTIMDNSAGEAVKFAEALESNGENFFSWDLDLNLSIISRSTECQLMVTDAEGIVQACSDETPVCEHIGQQLPEEIAGVLTKAKGMRILTNLDGLLEKEMIVVSREILADDGSISGYVVVSRDADKMFVTWDSFLAIALLIAMLVFFAALVFSLFYSKKMARPLDEMAEAARKFARGDFSVRVRQEEDSSYEMGALIDSFNKMADSLEVAEERRNEFIANISHELRTPMTTISGFAGGILDGTIPRDEQDKYLVSIRDETRRLSRLVRDMLDISRMKSKAADPSSRTDFDMSELVLQTMLGFESRATKKGLDVDPQLPEGSMMVHANKDAITQVVYNLIDNAVKFASADTCITIRLYKENGKAFFSVKDCGETIPPDDLPYIFDRFHKSDRSRSLDKDGVGLGLYLVKFIINSHDEDIAVKSEDGVTEFVFTLPLTEEYGG